jgi:hypothetical protein
MENIKIIKLNEILKLKNYFIDKTSRVNEDFEDWRDALLDQFVSILYEYYNLGDKFQTYGFTDLDRTYKNLLSLHPLKKENMEIMYLKMHNDQPAVSLFDNDPVDTMLCLNIENPKNSIIVIAHSYTKPIANYLTLKDFLFLYINYIDHFKEELTYPPLKEDIVKLKKMYKDMYNEELKKW